MPVRYGAFFAQTCRASRLKQHQQPYPDSVISGLQNSRIWIILRGPRPLPPQQDFANGPERLRNPFSRRLLRVWLTNRRSLTMAGLRLTKC